LVGDVRRRIVFAQPAFQLLYAGALAEVFAVHLDHHLARRSARRERLHRIEVLPVAQPEVAAERDDGIVHGPAPRGDDEILDGAEALVTAIDCGGADHLARALVLPFLDGARQRARVRGLAHGGEQKGAEERSELHAL
jgi:hypothetical protein